MKRSAALSKKNFKQFKTSFEQTNNIDEEHASSSNKLSNLTIQSHKNSELNQSSNSISNVNLSTEILFNDTNNTTIPQICGRLLGIELQNFMCHKHLKLNFDISKSNCYYIIGSNGSGKSALFAAINIGLGGKGSANDRGNSLQAYIKEGEKTAKIRVMLSNEGANALNEYGSEIIIERSITESTSSYVLKSKEKNENEEIKSRKKADLDQILHKFGIELDNPLAWLSQDRSRQFLQQMKPEKLYNIFMISTELESTEKIYESILSYIEETNAYIKVGMEKKEKLKIHYEKMVNKLKAVVKIEELEKMKSEAQWHLLWAEIRDNKECLQVELNKLKQLGEKKANFEIEMISLDNQKNLLNKEKEESDEKLSNFKIKVEETKSCYDNLSTKSSRCERDLNSAAKLLEQKKSDLLSIDREIRETQTQLDRLVGNFNTDYIGEEKELLKEKENILNTLTNLDKDIIECEKNKKTLFEVKEQKVKELQQSEFELRQKNEILQGIYKDKETCILSRKNRLALLGSDIPKICQLIQINHKLFEKPPIGPIVCTEKNEPSSEFLTILRILDIDNPTVYNALVDQLSLEDFLLIERDDDARKIMRQNPPKNGRQALTMRCSNVFPASGNRPYRFYCNSNVQDARFLVDDSNLSKRDFTIEAKKVELAIEEQKVVVEEALKQANIVKKEFSLIDRNRQFLTSKKYELEEVIKKLDDKYQNLQKLMNNDPVIENLKAALQENQQLRKESLKSLENAKQNLLNINDEKIKIGNEIATTKKDFELLNNELKKLQKTSNKNEKKLEELLEEINNTKSKLNKCETLRLRFESVIHELEEKDVELNEKCKIQKKNSLMFENYSDPPNFDTILETNVILAKLKDYDKQIETLQKMSEDVMPTEEQVEKLREVCKSHNAKLKKFQSYLNRFEAIIAVRREKLNILKFALPHNLARSFKEQMLMRNFNGSLVVDHENKTITLSVETHKKAIVNKSDNENEENENLDIQKKRKKVIQDLKGLSGGERSFTTACFVMALWECVDFPFCCLDEFDVFMDMLNRRVVMEMLVDLAMEHKKNQFFFFTPQGITELKNRNNIEIFNLPRIREAAI